MSASEGERAMATPSQIRLGHPDSPQQYGAVGAYLLPGHPNRVELQFWQEASVPLGPHFGTS